MDDFHVIHRSGVEAISCQCTPEVGPSLVRSQEQWRHNTPAEPHAIHITFTASEAGSDDPMWLTSYCTAKHFVFTIMWSTDHSKQT